jgi:translation initiation factor 1
MAKEAAKIRVRAVKRSYGKMVTIVEGINDDANPKELTKKLKTKLAAGGTYKEGRIELQGNHKDKVRKLLLDAGFSEEQIEVE